MLSQCFLLIAYLAPVILTRSCRIKTSLCWPDQEWTRFVRPFLTARIPHPQSVLDLEFVVGFLFSGPNLFLVSSLLRVSS